MPAFPRRHGIAVLAAFLVVACLQAWPLPVRLGTHLTGPPSGDTGVYVWNTWIFGRELTERGGSPYFTSRILSLDPEVDLSLHNYTPFADLLALPLQPWLGVVGAFNVVYLLNVALAGFGAFVLARRLTGSPAAAFLAGVAFAASPFLVARSAAHFSLVSAAPLPFFVYWLDRAWLSQRLRDAIATGAVLAWAALSDPYYAIYCVLLGAAMVLGRCLTFTPAAVAGTRRRLVRVLIDAALIAAVAIIVVIEIAGGGAIRVASLTISMRSLYTPMLILTALTLTRVALMIPWRLSWLPRQIRTAHIRAGAVTLVAAALLLAPMIYAIGRRVIEGRMVSAPVLWRSSAPGVDLAALIAPNPTHPLAPETLTRWLSSLGGGFVENVASIPLVALATILWARWRKGVRMPRYWLWITAAFAVLALGPFVHVAGVNTYIPTPWALLRYVPIVGAARMPSRFAVLVALGVAMLFAAAIAGWLRQQPDRRLPLLAALGLLLTMELWPVPRVLYSATMPAVYGTIAADPRPVRVLELPFGIRDGLSSLGDYSAAAQFHQTFHGKALVGGYLSRLSTQRKESYRRMPVRHALIVLSERRALSPGETRAARVAARGFLARANLGYVVMTSARVTPELRDFAIALFGLVKIAEADGYELYVPTDSG